MHDPTTIPHPRVLVTGATGFIGRRLIDALQASGRRVRALVRDQTHGLPGEVETFTGDLQDPTSLVGIELGLDGVIHCASLLGKWGADDSLVRAVNVTGVLNLLERFDGVPVGRFLHLSAGGVTGPVKQRQVDETYDCRPATVYEQTKLEGEQCVLDRGRRTGIPVVVVRPTFTYGPGDPHKLALFRAVKKGRYAFIDKGESVNHPVYIEDLISGILLALERGRVGEVYIIGGERPVTKRELVYAIADALEVSRPWLRIPRLLADPAAQTLEWLGQRLGFEPILTRSRVMMMADNFGYSIAKASRELGYEPRVALEQGIRRTVASYVKEGLL